MTPLLPALFASAAVLVAVGLPLRSIPLAHGPGSRRGPSIGPVALAVPVFLGLTMLSGLTLAVAGAAAILLAARLRHLAVARRQREGERASAVEALEVMSAELKVGRSAAHALAGAAEVAEGPLARALAEAGRITDVGGDVPDCLLGHADTSAVPEVLRGLAVCWRVCASAGSSLALAVERLAQALAVERRQRDEVEAELAGARSSAAMLAVLPAFGILLGSGMGAHPLHVLLHTPVGLGCVAIGVVFEALGIWWTSRIVASAGGQR